MMCVQMLLTVKATKAYEQRSVSIFDYLEKKSHSRFLQNRMQIYKGNLKNPRPAIETTVCCFCFFTTSWRHVHPTNSCEVSSRVKSLFQRNNCINKLISQQRYKWKKLNIKFFVKKGLTPVSYTHLDVYKRQVQ